MKARSKAKAETAKAETMKHKAVNVPQAADPMLASIAYDERMRPGAPPDAVPADAAVLRLAMTRRMATLVGDPLRCREARCRRTRRCVGPTMRCCRDFRAPPSTPEEDAALMAIYRKALAARARELGIE